MTAALKKNDTGFDLAQEFRELAERYCEIGRKEGVRVIPFLGPEMPLFQKASLEERRNATDFLRTIVSIHEETIASGTNALNSRQLIWRALSRFQLTPPSDIFDRFTDEHIILFYNDQHFLLFWNLQFFKY